MILRLVPCVGGLRVHAASAVKRVEDQAAPVIMGVNIDRDGVVVFEIEEREAHRLGMESLCWKIGVSGMRLACYAYQLAAAIGAAPPDGVPRPRSSRVVIELVAPIAGRQE